MVVVISYGCCHFLDAGPLQSKVCGHNGCMHARTIKCHGMIWHNLVMPNYAIPNFTCCYSPPPTRSRNSALMMYPPWDPGNTPVGLPD